MVDESVAPERRDFYVYALFREDGTPFYVGKGKGRRCRVHLFPSVMNRTPKAHIIRRMLEAGHGIKIEKLAEGLTEAEAFATERETIARIGRRPHGPLWNFTDGGDGASGVQKGPGWCERASEWSRRAWRERPEMRQKAAERCSTPEFQAASIAYWADPENRRAAAERAKARLAAEADDPAKRETRRKAHARGWTEEAKRAAAERARMRAAERRADPEQRAALSAAHKAYWAANPQARRAQAERARAQMLKRYARE